jgi:hypothetical protein
MLNTFKYKYILNWVLILTVSLFSLPSSFAVRNAEAESICQPFLTSPKTSPILSRLPRNFSFDEDGEFACELVLQDESLPPQIRVTILEGLAYLAVRHVQQGLGIEREFDAYRFFKDLTNILPSSHSFALLAGQWAADLMVGRYKEAVRLLQ